MGGLNLLNSLQLFWNSVLCFIFYLEGFTFYFPLHAFICFPTLFPAHLCAISFSLSKQLVFLFLFPVFIVCFTCICIQILML